MMTRRGWIAAASTAGLSSCKGSPKMIVGSNESVESRLLSEIACQLLEKKLEARPDRRFGLTGTSVTYQSVQNRDMDLYPEYTRVAYKVLLRTTEQFDSDRMLTVLQENLTTNAQASCLPFLGFDNSYVVVAMADHPVLGQLRTFSEACAIRGGWRFGCSSSFTLSPEGYDELKQHYKLEERMATRIEPVNQLYFGLREHRIDMLVTGTTDPRLTDPRYKVFDDDLRVLGPNRCTFVYRLETARKYPSILPVLQTLSGRIDTGMMRKLNGEVELQKRGFAEVAAEWLKQQSLA